MPLNLYAVCFDARDPDRLAAFWAGVLGWRRSADRDGGSAVLPTDDTGFRLRFRLSRAPKAAKNHMHLDLTSSSADHQQGTVAQAMALGAQHIDVGQRPEEGHVVLADPEGNEFCVIGAGNAFLADCGFLGAVACDGSQQVGYFWSDALGWPLVWDQDQETAIRSPDGGPKLTWGGPPLPPKTGTRRLQFEVAPTADGDHTAEVDRLLTLGATRVEGGGTDARRVVLADPDGNEFSVLAPR